MPESDPSNDTLTGINGCIPEQGDVDNGIAGWCNPCNWRGYKENGPGVFRGGNKITDVFTKKFRHTVDELGPEFSKSGAIVKSLLIAFGYIIYILTVLAGSVAGSMTRLLPAPTGCDTTRYRSVQYMRMFWGQVRRIFGGLPSGLEASIEKESNYACPTQTPGQGELDNAFRRGFISEDEWIFGTRLNGNCVPWAHRTYESGQTFLSMNDLLALYRAKKLDRNGLVRLAKKDGVTDPDVVSMMEWLNRPTPSLSELFTGIQRNVSDPQVIATFGLDDDFQDRITPEVQKWIDRLGYSDEVLQFLWRSARPAVDQRVVLRLYKGGLLDRDGMVSVFMFNGHSRTIAEALADATVNQYAPAVAAAQGKPSLKEIEEAYAAGVLDTQGLRTWYKSVGVPDDQVNDHVSTTQLRLSMQVAKQSVNAVSKAFLSGRISDADLSQALVDAGIIAEQIPTIADTLRTRKQYSNKQIAMSQLCKFVSRGLIDMPEYMRRAANLGFDDADAALMAQSCNADIIEKRTKDQQREQRQALQLAQKQRKAREAYAKSLAAWYKKQAGCKAKTKPDCPPGTPLPTEPMPQLDLPVV